MTALRLVTVAILSWNGRHHLETCLDALAEQEDPGVGWEVLVLDNGSTDGTGDWLRTRYPQGQMADSAGVPASAAPPADLGLPSPPPRQHGRQAEEQVRAPFAGSPGWLSPSPGSPSSARSPLWVESRDPVEVQAAWGSPGSSGSPESRESPGSAEPPASPDSPGNRSPVRWLASPVNLGFCAGNNRLVAAAAGEAVAFLNNDTRPSRGWLAALVRALAAAPPDVAAVSGKIVDWEGERLDFGRGVMTFDGHAFQLDFRRPLGEARVPARGEELLFACGGNMLIRQESFLAAGGFDESYFAYLEDVDLGWRLWSGGERVIFEPEAVVRHRSNATSDLLGLFNRGFLFERNAFLTAYKNYQPGLWEKVMPALLLTFLSRTQTMLADNNPGGGSLRIDPYAGWIANTAVPAKGTPVAGAPATAAGPVGSSGERPSAGRAGGDEVLGAAPAATAAGRLSLARIRGKWREHGARELCRRAANKLIARLRAALPDGKEGLRDLASGGEPRAPILADERTVAQLRALSYLLSHLDAAAAAREAVQRRRRRPDAEIFARFPPYLVPTYPGDETLFASPGFTAWLPEELPLSRRTLEEVMELDPPTPRG